MQTGEIDRAIRFDINSNSPQEERSCQLFEFNKLQERFSSRNTDIGRVQMPYMLKNRINTHLNSAGLCVCSITPPAVKIASSKPDKQAGFPLVFALSLKALENFCDLHSVSSAQAVGDSQTRIFDTLALIPRSRQIA